MKYYCLPPFVALLLVLSIQAGAQKDSSAPLITGDFRGIGLEKFMLELEKQSGYRFFYDTAHFDTTKLTISVQQQPLSRVLETAFAGTSFRYSVYGQKNIFISKGTAVRTTLPRGIFDDRNDKTELVSSNVPDMIDEDTITDLSATLENKLYVIGNRSTGPGTGNVVLSGEVRDVKTGEPIPGVAIFLEKLKVSAITDQYGSYSITLPKGRHVLNIQSIGSRDTRRQVMLYSNGKMNIDILSQVMKLKNVTVSSEKSSQIRNLQVGVQRIDIKAIKQVPVVFGEADVLRVVLMMPGVKSVGEASTGLNVRGGSADQNLIFLNDITVFNPSHFFGMFSAFNPETIKDVELFKSGIPARYGGRLSSVLQINTREGNKKNFTGSAGIGLLTSRFNIEGPIKKDKTSFILGARTTYANWLLKLLPDQYKNSKAAFYDVNLAISHEINKKNNLYLTAYISRDQFNLNNDTAYHYNNRNISVKWKHIFNTRLYALVSGGFDSYKYGISSDQNPVNAYKLSFDINQGNFKTHFNYYAGAKHTLEFGLNTLMYKLHPGNYEPVGAPSLVLPVAMQAEQALESAVYLGDKYTISQNLSVEGGVRYSMFNYLGAKTINGYPSGVPKTEDNVLGETVYDKGKIIKTYHGAEFRLSARYTLGVNSSVKASYNSQRQYIHVLSNTAAMAPTDIWKLSDPNIKPQYGDQYSVGFYKNFKSNTIETSVEVYYKTIKDYLDYKSGAILVMNKHIETDVVNTKGKAYGVELLLKKSTGKFNGWISYTYSRTLLQMNDTTVGDLINKGKYYPANYDKPHDITVVSNYRFSHRFSVSLNATYSTGRPITLPIGVFNYAGTSRTLYSERNAYRIPDYFRTDFSMNLDGNHKVNQKTHNSWTIGVYNLTGRKNPYSVYYVSENAVINGYKLSIFGSIIPFINFNIRFL